MISQINQVQKLYEYQVTSLLFGPSYVGLLRQKGREI
jgi:hypothetical protein